MIDIEYLNLILTEGELNFRGQTKDANINNNQIISSKMNSNLNTQPSIRHINSVASTDMKTKPLPLPSLMTKFNPTMNARKSRLGMLNPRIISTILIVLILANEQSISTPIFDSLARSHSIISSHNQNRQTSTTYGSNILAEAAPVPDPKPASSRVATSVTHRHPPINGSIFGKKRR